MKKIINKSILAIFLTAAAISCSDEDGLIKENDQEIQESVEAALSDALTEWGMQYDEVIEHMESYKSDDVSEFIWDFITTAFACVGDTLVIQMQDYLELDNDARMNTPGAPMGNWQWRMKRGVYDDALAERIADITRTYGRCPR
jgi:4-alpha-glucanotransferase